MVTFPPENIDPTEIGMVGFEQKATLKLTKNSKGYTWEIKQLSLDIEELVKLNNKMLEKFGNEGLL